MIDRLLAKSLRDDYERLSALIQKQYAPRAEGGPLTAAELIEEQELRATIADRARAIGCPASYGPIAQDKDSKRLHQLWAKRRSPDSSVGGLTDAEDAEEAQLRARVLAFEYRADDRRGSPAEQKEYEQLRREDPLLAAAESWRRAADRHEQEEKERARQRQACRDKQRAPDKSRDERRV